MGGRMGGSGGIDPVDWAGVAFTPLGHRDGRFIHAPGLFAFVRRFPGGERAMLFVDHAEHLAQVAGPAHLAWGDCLVLGMNELHVCLKARSRVDRLQLRAHVVRRVQPLLNVLEGGEEAAAPAPVRLSA